MERLGAECARSGRFQPLDLYLELKAQLHAFFLWQPERHLRKDSAVQRYSRRLPRDLLGRMRYSQILVASEDGRMFALRRVA